IDDSLAEAHGALGYVTLVYDWDWAGAERELLRAIELNSGYASAHQWRGELLMGLSQPEEATKAFMRALDIDPLSIPCNLGLGWSYYFSHNYELAIEQYERTLEIAPNVPMALYGLGLSYYHKRLPEQGSAAFQRALTLFGGEAAVVMLMGVAHAFAGNRPAAEKDLEELRELSRQKYVPAVYSAFIYAVLDDLDHAFEYLQKACDERSSYMIFLNVQPSLDNLRPDPRFHDLLKRVGLR
ncbi:MAG TPA: tetratricopeptide repeat protein, partial [Candidatus Angelobacter sp.]|nr:tetratricopeptide repeat protein [Candidatus Angelobacter sp.]